MLQNRFHNLPTTFCGKILLSCINHSVPTPQYCQNYPQEGIGNLVEIESADQNSFITMVMDKGYGDRKFWIGLDAIDNATKFVWHASGKEERYLALLYIAI